MSQPWGRGDAAGVRPPMKTLWTLGPWRVVIVVGVAIGAYRYRVAWTALQRVHLGDRVRSALASVVTAWRYPETQELMQRRLVPRQVLGFKGRASSRPGISTTPMRCGRKRPPESF
jgi:hypothetical protein